LYERIHPNLNGEVSVLPAKDRRGPEGVDVCMSQGRGPVYVVQGNTGAMQGVRWIQPQPEYSAIRFSNGFIPPTDRPAPAAPAGDSAETKPSAEQGKGKGEGEDNSLDGPILDGNNYLASFGLGVMTLHNATHMHYRNVPVTDVEVGGLADEFWVVKRV
jgi:hypothetical protein